VGLSCCRVSNSSISSTAEKEKKGVRLKMKMADSRDDRGTDKCWRIKVV